MTRVKKTDRPTTPNLNCTHRDVHYHGTVNCLMADGCRCEPCVWARRRYNTSYYRNSRSTNPTPNLYTASDEPPHVEDLGAVGSATWLAAMRLGLLKAVRASIQGQS